MTEVKYGNAAAFGFVGFALPTMLISLFYANMFPYSVMLLGMFIFVGGIAELIAGIMLWKMGDTFASLAFSAFGVFWLTLSVIEAGTPANLNLGPASVAASTGAFLLLWGIFAGGMAVAALKAPKTVLFLLAGLSLLFFLLAAAVLNANTDIQHVAGYWGVIDGFSGLYISLALVINESHGRTILPLGVPKAK